MFLISALYTYIRRMSRSKKLGEPNKVPSVMPTEREFLCSVYVVLLNPEVVNTPQIKRRNPKRDPLKPCVYVGLTGLRVDRYFDYRGVKADPDTWPLHKYGIRLMPELYEHLNPMPFEKAVHSAEKLAEDLRAEGYTVTNAVSARKERYRAVKATLARECRRLISPHNRSRD